MPWPRGSRHARGYGYAWVKRRKRILERDGHLCQACARKSRVAVGNEVHHRVPRAQGGSEDDINLETLCHDCHLEADAESQGRTLSPGPRKPATRHRVALDGTLVEC